MKIMFSSQRQSLLLMVTLLALPLSLSAVSQEFNDEAYVYCDKNYSKMAEIVAEISKFDEDKNSPVCQLNDHINKGFNIGRQDAIVEALAWAEEVLNKNYKHFNSAQFEEIQSDLNTVISAVVDGELTVDVQSLHNNESFRKKTLKIEEPAKFYKNVTFKDKVDFKHFVGFHGRVKFYEDVEFKNNVIIDGTLSVADQIVGCDLTVGCNISINDSVSPAIGNIIKNGIPFIHNFGTNNTFVGDNAGNFTMAASGNAGFGTNALSANTLGLSNTAIGTGALQDNTEGDNNTAIGNSALTFNTTGSANTAVGELALSVNTIGINNTAMGQLALAANTTGSFNTAVGQGALEANTIGTKNTAVGIIALNANTTGFNNSAVGRSALTANTIGIENAAFGDSALASNTIGNNNTALGADALLDNTTGSGNTAVGLSALSMTTIGSNNIGVGVNAGGNYTFNESGNICIGSVGVASENNTTRIGSTQTSAFVAGISGVTTGLAAVAVLVDANGQLGTVSSTRRVKHDIQDMDADSASIYDLRPVTFVYNGDASETRQYGLIAEEVDQAFPAIVARNKNGQIETVQYHVLPVLLLNEVQKQQASIADLTERVMRLEENAPAA